MTRIKRSWRLVLATMAALTVASVAFAFWTNGGSGNGTAAVGTAANNLVVTAFPGGALYPGTSTAVDIRVDSPISTQFASLVKRVALDLTKGGGDGIEVLNAGVGNGGCPESWFHFNGDGIADQPYIEVNATIQPGDFVHVDGGAGFSGTTLSMEESGTNQDDCKSAQVKLHLAIDNS